MGKIHSGVLCLETVHGLIVRDENAALPCKTVQIVGIFDGKFENQRVSLDEVDRKGIAKRTG